MRRIPDALSSAAAALGGIGPLGETYGHGGMMFALKDRRGNEFCLGPESEELATDVFRKEVTSYRQLPKRLYQIQTKLRDGIRPRFGLLQARESLMLDVYSFDTDAVASEVSSEAVRQAYHRIWSCVGLRYRAAEADAEPEGYDCHKMMALSSAGALIVSCNVCDYAATQERADSRLEAFPQDKEQRPMEAVFGPGLIGVEPLAEFLRIPVWKTTKTLLYQADDRVVAVMVRGDCDVNEGKVRTFLNCEGLTLAAPEAIKELTDAEVGYAGPIGLPPEVLVIADHDTRDRINFECGANRTDYHNINVNFERDLPLPTFGDFKLAKGEHLCPRCDAGRLREAWGIEIGQTLDFGSFFSERLNCAYLDPEGKSRPVHMGHHALGISQTAAAAIEQNHDDRGIIWPVSIAPFQVHLIALNPENEAVRTEAERLYQRFIEEKVEVLFDDRDLRAGEKFSDADLLGMPIRLTLSRRTCQEGKMELRFRNKETSELLTYEETMRIIKNLSN